MVALDPRLCCPHARGVNPVTALAQLGGTASYAELTALTTRRKIRTAVTRGVIDRAALDVYCLRTGSADVENARSAGASLGGLSAALHHGWPVRFAPHRTELVRAVPKADRVGWATSPLRTIRDCATLHSFADALSVADSALRSGSVTYDSLTGAARVWPGRAQRVAQYADGRAANPFESSLRAIAIEAGLSVAAQWEVVSRGLVLHPDVADPMLGLALEADSYAHHGATRADHERDCERYNALVLAGWRVLRFTWSEVMFDPDRVIATMQAAIPNSYSTTTRSTPRVSKSAA